MFKKGKGGRCACGKCPVADVDVKVLADLASGLLSQGDARQVPTSAKKSFFVSDGGDGSEPDQSTEGEK